MKYIIPFTLIAMVILACEETTVIDVDQSESRLVIEGLITNQTGQQFVSVSRTIDFYAPGFNPGVSDATVTVSDDLGGIYPFTELEDNPGRYVPVTPFVGIVGRTYSLEVDALGQTYTAQEAMLSVTSIDSLTSTLNEEERSDPEDAGRFYEVFMYTKEPQDEENFYLFKFYRNGHEQNENGEDISVTNDVGVAEDIEGIELPVFYAINDTATVEIYSLTRTSYIYWSDVANLVFSDGGIFSPLPANPRSNIQGGALGVFQVSAVALETLVVQE